MWQNRKNLLWIQLHYFQKFRQRFINKTCLGKILDFHICWHIMSFRNWSWKGILVIWLPCSHLFKVSLLMNLFLFPLCLYRKRELEENWLNICIFHLTFWGVNFKPIQTGRISKILSAVKLYSLLLHRCKINVFKHSFYC